MQSHLTKNEKEQDQQVKPLFLFLAFFLFVACAQKEMNDKKVMTPWDVVEESSDTMEHYSLERILESGELRALTIAGENTYYSWDKAYLGTHYLLGEMLAKELGVELKVEECTDTLEMVQKLAHDDADLIIMPVNKEFDEVDSLLFCGPEEEGMQWVVMEYNQPLAKAIDKWYQPGMIDEADKKVSEILKNSVHCHVYEPVLDKGKGVISQYDNLFKAYASIANADWRLLAAISYQESCFDPKACSWAGACGLMQVMPETALSVGLPIERIFDPEPNVEAAAKVINQLNFLFRDIPNSAERLNFVLASYNGGQGHVRDAMALTEKNGGDPYVWENVSEYILLLSQPRYYRDAVVKCGYMRGTETHDYVDKVRERYEEYMGFAEGADFYGVHEMGGNAGVSAQPQRRSQEKNRYQI